jgi:hypothetical protein
MTALDERLVTAATDHDIAVYEAAVTDYIDRHRHDEPATRLGRSAKRAGLGAVLADRHRHPVSTVQAGLQVTALVDECRALQGCGWLLVGLGQHRITGDVLYVLERAEKDGAA